MKWLRLIGFVLREVPNTWLTAVSAALGFFDLRDSCLKRPIAAHDQVIILPRVILVYDGKINQENNPSDSLNPGLSYVAVSGLHL